MAWAKQVELTPRARKPVAFAPRVRVAPSHAFCTMQRSGDVPVPDGPGLGWHAVGDLPGLLG